MAEENQYSGEVIQAGLEKTAKDLGVDIRTGTKGEDLILDGKDVIGVKVTNNDNESYDINAQAVIIATGGFCSNKDCLLYTSSRSRSMVFSLRYCCANPSKAMS